MTRTNTGVRESVTLYVEARKLPHVDDGYGTDNIETQVQEYLRRTYREINLGQAVPLSSSLAKILDRIEIKGHSRSRTLPDSTTYLLTGNNIGVTAYTLHTDEECNMHGNTKSDETPLPLPLHVTALPHQNFDGYWEALIYKEPIGDQLLRVLTGAIRKFHNRPEDLLQNAWYNTALFSGPPGSGKTSLAQALAQQLSIRMSDLYSNTKLLQVDASAIFSHMYGGTAREVSSMFATIRQLAMNSDEAQLVVVLIDEVDKLVPCRKDVGRKNEPLDTIRATAEVLTGLDKLRKSINVVWLFTTNLLEDLDPAFVDRCRLKEIINAPAASCAYDMLRTEINAKLRRGEILVDSMIYDLDHDAVSTTTPKDLPAPRSDVPPHVHAESLGEIPTVEWARRYWPLTLNTAVVILQRIATLAAGLSGRNLRGLLDVALFTYWVDDDDQPSLQAALAALEIIVRKETGRAGNDEDSDSLAEGELVGQADGGDVGELPVGGADCSRLALPIETNVYSSDC